MGKTDRFYVLKRPRNGNTATSDFKTAKTPSSILRVAVLPEGEKQWAMRLMKTSNGTRITAPTQNATSRLKHELMNDALRGVSPGRARDTLQRSGSFEPGHKKRGSRRRAPGT